MLAAQELARVQRKWSNEKLPLYSVVEQVLGESELGEGLANKLHDDSENRRPTSPASP